VNILLSSLFRDGGKIAARRAAQKRRAPYSLIVSIHAPEARVDPYSAIEQEILVSIPQPVPI